ncbi:hypothetical protein CsatB_024857 [Cannabis sativa]|uniref:cyclin-dependent kinase n=1 Tax=Cannabis sativa TaxID=3483 RepID=A0A7J6GJZ3_CANSA|nr:serine/threonine-protein kinase MHK [Cannabis sativa]KAF4367536.1 hypothetical protein G4B88_003740 [Cannabis sativa]KAF4370322.1 hypothetical protein G4B88_013006 [Cannabis sativa]KAF4383128.1 hypothetical protein F8388_009159 [Cannabis sativa]
MERYTILEELGDGTCGTVYKAIDSRTHEIVAVKKMKRKFYFWEEYWRLREIKVLRRLSHPNIIKLNEVVRENDEVFLIFEYMNLNLYQMMRDRQRPFSEDEIRSFIAQVLHGLDHIHRNRYFHRDLKPENLLVTNDLIKIADFGLAREVSSMPPYTEYVSTRWYRAPEVLLQSKTYTPAVDMWAVGAILAELFTFSPIFPGESEIDQLFKICCVLGTPDIASFPEGTNISRLFGIVNYEKIAPANLSHMIPNASPEAIDLILQLCSWDPSRRPSANESLQHPFFKVTWVPRLLRDPLELKLSNMGAQPNLELKLSDFGSEPEDCFLGLTLAVKPSVPSLDLVHDVSHGDKNALFCSDLEDRREQSVFWSLISPERNGIRAPVETSFSLSFSSIQHPAIMGAQSGGFSIPALQPNILDGPFLGMSTGFPRRSLPLSD